MSTDQINQRLDDPKPAVASIHYRTKEDYFNNNNNQGYQAPKVITLRSPNINVELHYNHLKPSKLETIEQAIQAVSTEFFKAFKPPTPSNAPPEIFRLYLFDNHDDYQHFGGKQQFNWGLGSEGGKAHYRGRSEVHSEIYMYQQGNVLNLQHELTHALTFYVTGGNYASIPQWLIEGIAEYFEHQKGVVHVSQEEAQALTTETLGNLDYSEDPKENNLLYRMGHAVVSYLQAEHPELLGNYFILQKNQESKLAHSLLQEGLADLSSLKSWLREYSLENQLHKSNVLRVISEDHPIGTRVGLVGNQVKKLIFHPAAITSQNGDKVGRFSSILHLWQVNTVRATNRATNDYLDIPKDYGFLKVLNTAQEGLQLGYCDQNGHLYLESQHYKETVLNKIIKLVPAWQSTVEALHQKKDQAATAHNQAHQKALNAYQDYQAAENSSEANGNMKPRLSSLYQKYLTHREEAENARELISQSQENIKKFKKDLNLQDANPLVERFKALLQIAPYQLAETTQQDLQNWKENQVLTLKSLGQGDHSALSLYSGNIKVGELSTEVGFFRSIDNPEELLTKDSPKEFIYEDSAKNLNTCYQEPHLAVTQTDNGYRLAFIEDKSIQGDSHFAEPHFHQNELLKPGLQHIEAADLQPLLLKGKILNHAESPTAHYSEEQRKNGLIVETGELLDDKGTRRTDDDNYAAVLKQGEQLLHHFTSTGFYITEAIKNSQGEITCPSSFFIHDYGRNLRWQLPEAITHLKLVTTPTGKRKLAPCEANGNESPEGMPEIPEEYRLIDPIFAHRYAKQDHSHQHTTIGLINFDSYADETCFAIQYDPKDASIRRDAQGNIVRESDGRTYFTKVKLWDGDKEIGMLSNNFHNFTGEIFFSVDLNYSYTDFLATVSARVARETTPDGVEKFTFNRGAGDLAGTDRGYTDHTVIFDRPSAPQQSAQLAARMASLPEQVGVDDRALEQQETSPRSTFSSRLLRTHG